MSTRSPRRSAARKPGRSVKEKRLIKKSRKAVAENDRLMVFLRGEPGSPASRAWRGELNTPAARGAVVVSPAAAFSLVPVHELHEAFRVATR
jgi:hypothetical protein